MTKSKAAFLLTAERLWQPGFRVYFWTFTFSTVHADWEASKLFRAFLNHLRQVIPGDWGGVRVVEIHKGEFSHGLHYHALLNRRLAVDIVRRVAKCHGIGRIFVEVASQEPEMAEYLAKYLGKGKVAPLCESGRKMRRWASFGHIRKTRICDLVNESPQWVYRREHKMPFISYRWEVLLQRVWWIGETEFAACYGAAKRGEEGNILGVIHGQMRVNDLGMFTYRASESVRMGVVAPF